MGARSERNAATRERILEAAERLFAESGLYSVSNRQIAEAAGQGNTAVVGYHFGTKADLVRAVVSRRSGVVEARRRELVDRLGSPDHLRAWIACLVRPSADLLAGLGVPSWYARFAAQVMTDPAMRELMRDDALSGPGLREVLAGLEACLPAMPEDVRAERAEVSRLLMVHVLAEHERTLAAGGRTARDGWQATTTGLVDVLLGVWLAPVTPVDDDHHTA